MLIVAHTHFLLRISSYGLVTDYCCFLVVARAPRMSSVATRTFLADDGGKETSGRAIRRLERG